ncbi:hypothetical protein J437_LFUL013226 [Ladona fulva]|uniref:Uncharacterized protein n=1 Tax=Ladona fulva TaxID=123851 RepID=A0A8K0KEW8_LADFU|nr:hypothetical protein J437_LFUL013226 [Ladona fulva]
MTISIKLVLFLCAIHSLAVEVTGRRQVVIIVSIDGFRYDYIKAHNLSKLSELQREGTHSERMFNVFDTNTYPNHQSIATGLYPESHGVISNEVYDPKYRRVIKYGADLYEEDDILNEITGNGSYSGVMMWPGGEFPYGKTKDRYESLRNTKILPTYYQEWDMSIPWEVRIDTIIHWITHPTKPTNLVMLYFEEPDLISHAFGPESDLVKTRLEDLDRVLRYLCEKINYNNLTDFVNVIVVSDHGMKTVTSTNIIDLRSSVNISLFNTAASSPVMHIYPKPGYEDIVFRQLNASASRQPFKVYQKRDIPERWHIARSRRAPPILALADEGYVFQDFLKKIYYYSITAHQTYGVHGYDNALDSMHPLFLAWGPLIKRGYEIEPFSAVDIFPLVCKILDLPYHPVNGTLGIGNQKVKE